MTIIQFWSTVSFTVLASETMNKYYLIYWKLIITYKNRSYKPSEYFKDIWVYLYIRTVVTFEKKNIFKPHRSWKEKFLSRVSLTGD